MSLAAAASPPPPPPLAPPSFEAEDPADPDPREPPRSCVRKDQLADFCRERRSEVRTYLEGYPDMLRFLKDHAPDWAAVENCRRTFRYVRWKPDSQWWTAKPYSCHQLPWCTLCSKAETYRRVKETFDTLSMATPTCRKALVFLSGAWTCSEHNTIRASGPGVCRVAEPIRAIHIVQTAMANEDGSGWGRAASRDPGKFLKVVWETLRGAYGEGIGAVMSYQDFGERAFAKRHPHADLTLNGYQILNGEVAPTKRYNLTHGGYDRWMAAFEGHAATAFGDGTGRFPGHFKIGGLRIGVHNYWGTLRYQMRELVDLRKLDYSPTTANVWWRSYAEPTRQRFTVKDFFYGMQEYQKRLGTWGGADNEDDKKTRRLALHRRYGIVSDRLLERTAEITGGTAVPHGASCPCYACNDWERVQLDEVDRELGRPSPLL